MPHIYKIMTHNKTIKRHSRCCSLTLKYVMAIALPKQAQQLCSRFISLPLNMSRTMRHCSFRWSRCAPSSPHLYLLYSIVFTNWLLHMIILLSLHFLVPRFDLLLSSHFDFTQSLLSTRLRRADVKAGHHHDVGLA